MIKKTVCIIFFLILFTMPVKAESYDLDGLYNEQFENSDFDEIYSLIDDETKEIVDKFGFDPQSIDSFENFTLEKLLDIVSVFFKDGLKAPLGVFASVVATSILIGTVKSAEPENKNFGMSDLVGVSVVTISIITPTILFFKATVATIKSTATFMTGFIPIFAGILVTSGKPTTSTLTSASLLLSAEVCELISGYIVLPFVSVYLAITIASSFSDKVNISLASSSIQKAVSFSMTSIMTVFTAIISIQSIIGNSSDSAALRVFRLLAGSTPIIGGAISEATGVVSSCINILKNSVVIYAVICLIALFLPIIIELLMWRLSMFCSGIVAGMLGTEKISNLVNSIGYVFGVVTSVSVNTLIMFVVSLAVVMVTTGGVS